MSRLLRQVLLALSLVLAQQAGIAHLTAHAAQLLRDPPAAAQDNAASCSQCVLYASLGSSPLPAVAALACERLPILEVAAAPRQPLATPAFAAYRSRAPPRTA